MADSTSSPKSHLETATLGSGCFWCTEAVLERLKGVENVVSGYSGGDTADPTYEQVSSGETGHVEVVQVSFDPKIVSFEQILEVFFTTHDPTTLNRQGNDVGTQYRSVVFYHDENQKKATEKLIKKLDSDKIWNDPIVTTVEPFTTFTIAEDYHQDFYANNPKYGYCTAVINPKLAKLRQKFQSLLKD